VVKVKAPAKINLTLEVLGNRPDGYHEIKSVLQAVSLCDNLTLKKSRDVTFQCDLAGWSAEQSLMTRVVSLVCEVSDCQKGVAISIEKRIPLMAGLGGDSSDAAALLRGLNDLWGPGLSLEELRKLASELGSDVAYFLTGGTALVEGRGEIITPLPSLSRMWVVLMVPEIPVKPGKTGRMYSALKQSHFTDGRITGKLVQTLHKDRPFHTSLLFNTFENIAFENYPGLQVYKEHLTKLGAPHVHLAGAGPTLFTMLADKEKAEDLYARCQDQKMKVYLAETL
jgi:4-diphosphocytidyl-2-C-methyl-D-erythritol kinase